MLYAIVAALAIIVDQWVKYWTADTIAFNSGIKEFIPGVLSLVNVHNDGAAFSMLAGGGARIYFIILTGIFTVAVILALATRFISGRFARWSLVMVTAGGISNCIDRIIYGYVQDMFKVELFDFAVFNVADIFITVFAFLFALAMIFEKDPEPDDLDQAIFAEDNESEDRPSRRRKAEKAEKAEEAPAERMPRLPRMSASREVSPEEAAKKPAAPSRKERRARYEEEYEQYKARRAARQQEEGPAAAAAAAAAAFQKSAPVKSSDPFAEWEKTAAKPEAGLKPAPAPQNPPIDELPVQKEDLPAPTASDPEKVSAAPASNSLSFDLDDILSEFK